MARSSATHLKRLGLPAPNSSLYKDLSHDGRRVSINLDGRTVIAKRIRAIRSAIIKDLGNDPTELQRIEADSVAGLVVLRGNLSARITDGLEVNDKTYCRITNSINRIASTLGLARQNPRDVTPDLQTYIASRHHHAEDSVEDADVMEDAEP